MGLMRATNRERALAGVLIALAVVVPWCVLTVVGMRQFQIWPAAAVPFGLNRILVCHLLAALPLAMWCGWQIPFWDGGRLVILCLVAIGLMFAAVAGSASDTLGKWSLQSDPLVNFVRRTVWVFVLVLPWCLAASILLKRATKTTVAYRADGLTALLVLALPFVYGLNVLDRQHKIIEDALANGQYWTALQVTRRLSVMGDTPFQGEPLSKLLISLQQTVDQIVQDVRQPLAPDADSSQIYERAFQHYRLGDFDQVRQLLGTLPTTSARASSLLALSYDAAGNWADAVQQYRKTIRLIGQEEEPALLRSSYERLANNLRRIGEYAEAERELKEAIDRWPQYRDVFLVQLGLHYRMAGRTSEALIYFEKAMEANPEMASRVEPRIKELQRVPEGCLLRPARGARR